MGDQNATAAPSGTFDAADGPINIAANRQEQFEKLCHAVGRPDLLTDPRFTDRDRRKGHRDELNDELNAALRRRPALAWEQELNQVGVPAARILTVPQMVELEQLAERRYFAEVPFPGSGDSEGSLRLSGNGVLVDGEPLHPQVPPPRLGEHNDDLEQLLQRWKAATVVGRVTR